LNSQKKINSLFTLKRKSSIKVGETITSSKKTFLSPPPSSPKEFEPNKTIHSLDCPNFLSSHFPDYHHEQRSRASSREYQKQQRQHNNRHLNAPTKSGFEELDYIINNARNNNSHKSKSRRSRSRTEFPAPLAMSAASSRCSEMSCRRASDLTSKSTNVLDDSSGFYVTGTSSIDNKNNDNTKAETEQEIPVLVALPMPSFDMPAPPQLFELQNQNSYPSTELLLNQSHDLDNMSEPVSKFPAVWERITDKKPPKCQMRSSSLNNILDDTDKSLNKAEHVYQNSLEIRDERLFSKNLQDYTVGGDVSAQNTVETQTDKLYASSLRVAGSRHTLDHVKNSLQHSNSSKKLNSKYATLNSVYTYAHVRPGHRIKIIY